MPRIFGEGRPPGRERWVIHYDCMTREDKEEMKRWLEELRKPLLGCGEFDASDAQPKGECRE